MPLEEIAYVGGFLSRFCNILQPMLSYFSEQNLIVITVIFNVHRLFSVNSAHDIFFYDDNFYVIKMLLCGRGNNYFLFVIWIILIPRGLERLSTN
jgi:hypothetical protein